DDLDGALDARAESARIGEKDFHGGYFRTRPPADSPAAPGVSAWRKPSRMTSAAPTVIAASATLNAGQCHPKAWKSRKSTTCPSRRRSITLPTAPPRMRARPAQRSLRPGERTRRAATTTEATTAKPASAKRCQPPWSARKLKAAPLLKTSTRLKNPVTATPSPGWKAESTSALTSWSTATTAAAAPNQGAASPKEDLS